MKPKEILVFGATGQIGRHLIRKLTKNNHRVIAVTRNIHQKGYILKTQANPGYLEIVELSTFDEDKINSLFKECSVCINLIGILNEKRENHFKNIHIDLPSFFSKIAKKYKIDQLIHISALGIENAFDRDAMGDVYFVDFGVQVVRPERCLKDPLAGSLPFRWLGQKQGAIVKDFGFDIDAKWQAATMQYWLEEHGFSDAETPYDD